MEMEWAAFFWWVTVIGAAAFTVGMILGSWGEARQWRERGDHDYMNRKESGGYLYQVKREQ